MDGHELVEHCNFLGPTDGRCAGSGVPPWADGPTWTTPRAAPDAPSPDEQAPAWAVAMENRIMAKLTYLMYGYHPPRVPRQEDAGRGD